MAENKNTTDPAPASGESTAELIEHLARVSGRRIRTREDISEYVKEISQKAKDQRSKRQLLKHSLLAALLILAAGQYYLLDVQLQILRQPTLTVFVPVKDDLGPKRPYI